MSATHDTHNWDKPQPQEESIIARRERECRERGEALEREAERLENLRQWREWRRGLDA